MQSNVRSQQDGAYEYDDPQTQDHAEEQQNQMNQEEQKFPIDGEDTPGQKDERNYDFIISLQENLKKVPQDCAEYHLQKLIYVTCQELKAPVQKIFQDSVNDVFKDLEQNLIDEELITSVSQEFQSIKSLIKTQSYASLLDRCKLLIRQLRPLDLNELFSYLVQVDQASQIISGQDIILLVGLTGSGKSTTTHYIAGSKMEKQVVKNLNHIGPKKPIKNKYLEKINCSPVTVSETRYLSPIPIQLTKEFPNMLSDYQSIVWCDSPGFQDMRGSEIDIANGMSIVRSIKQAKSVRLVILLSYLSMGDRLQSVKEVANILIQMIPNIQQFCAQSIFFLFSKFPQDESVNFRRKIADLYRNLTEEEKADKSFSTLLRTLHTKTSRGINVVDPFDQEQRTEYMEQILELTPIKSPDEEFTFSISERSYLAQSQQVNKMEKSIFNSYKRSKFGLLKYNLSMIKQLYTELDDQPIKKQYESICKKILELLNQEFVVGIQALNRQLSPDNQLVPEDIQAYKNLIQRCELSSTLNDYLGKSLIQVDALTQNIMTQANIIKKAIKETDVDHISVYILLRKIQILSESFPNIVGSYKEALVVLQENIDQTQRQLVKKLNQQDYKTFFQLLDKINKVIQLASDFLDIDELNGRKEKVIQNFFDYLISQIDVLEETFNKEKWVKADIEELKSTQKTFQTIKDVQGLNLYIDLNKFDEIFETFIQKILDHFYNVQNLVQEKYEKEKEDSFTDLETLIREMNIIRSLSMIESRTAEIYYSTVTQICQFVKDARRQGEQILAQLSANSEKVDYSELKKFLLCIKNAQWIEEFSVGSHASVMKEIQNIIYSSINNTQTILLELNLDLEHYENLEKGYKLFKQVQDMTLIQQFIENLDKQIEKTKNIFTDKLKVSLKFIEKNFNKQQSDQNQWQDIKFQQLETSLFYLDKLRSLGISEAQEDYSKLIIFIESYRKFAFNQVSNLLKEIQEYKEYSDRKTLQEKVNIVFVRLQEIDKLQKRYPITFKIVDPEEEIIRQLQNQIRAQIDNFEENLAQLSACHNTAEFGNQLIIIKQMTMIDEFIQKPAIPFTEIFRKFNEQLMHNIPNNERSMLDSIQNHDYQAVMQQMNNLESGKGLLQEHQMNQTIRVLTDAVSEFMRTTISLSTQLLMRDNVNYQNVERVCENIRKLEKAKMLDQRYFKTQLDIQGCIDNCQRLLEDGILEVLTGAKGYIISYNYLLADEILTKMNLINNLISKNDRIIKEAINVQQFKSDHINKLIESYKQNVDIYQYFLKPPKEIFDNLKNSYEQIYVNALSQLKEQIQLNFVSELDKIKKVPKKTQRDQMFTRIRQVLICLPQSLEFLRTAIDDTMNNTIMDEEQRVSKLDDYFSSNNYQDIADQLKKVRNEGPTSPIFVKIREYIGIQNKIHKDNVTEKLNNHNYEELIQALDEVKQFKTYFSKDFSEIGKNYQELKQLVQRDFDLVIKTIDATFVQEIELHVNEYKVHKKILKREDEEDMENEVNFQKQKLMRPSLAIQQLLILVDKYEFVTIKLEKEFFTNFDTILVKCLNNLKKQVSEVQLQYNKAMSTLDVIRIKFVMNVMRSWNPIMKEVRAKSAKFSSIPDFEINAFKAVMNGKLYNEMVNDIAAEINKCQDVIVKIELINDQTRNLEKDRQQFYEYLNSKFQAVNNSQVLKDHLTTLDLQKMGIECETILVTKIEEIIEKSETILANETLGEEDCQNMNVFYNNINSFANIVSTQSDQPKHKLKAINKNIEDKIEIIFKNAENDSAVPNIACQLVNLKVISQNILFFKEKVEERIEKTIEGFKKSNNGDPRCIAQLGQTLKSNRVGEQILRDNKQFEGFIRAVFAQKVKKHGIDYVMDNLEGTGLEKEKLKKKFMDFEKIYIETVTQYLVNPIKLKPIQTMIKELSGNQIYKDGRYEPNSRQNIVEIVAFIFALWTLKNAEFYFEARGLDNQLDYLLQPHPAQVVSIFRMLGVGDLKEKFENNLVQIGTGEGKSVTLGVVSSVFALFGFNVSCACYSEYLSNRDFKSFEGIFELLNVKQYIRYGTFNKLCEYVINQEGDIRQIVLDLIENGDNPVPVPKKQYKRPNILLIDEVDVFFSKDFYGNTYSPSASLRDPTINALIQYIWSQRKNQAFLLFSNLESAPAYVAAKERFKSWGFLVEEAAKDMLSDIKTFESHDYVVKEDKIGYKEQDNIIFNAVFGYKTLFAYFLEHEKGNISETSMEANITIGINCGEFSYADIPQNFQLIMGVTGTLKCLSQSEKHVVEKDYKILKFTYTPSVFGKNNLVFAPKQDIRIENENDYFTRINSEIEQRMMGRNPGTERAILVFFETKQDLVEFRNSSICDTLRYKMNILTEEATQAEKEQMISLTTNQGRITLFTSSFGRGTDFIQKDDIVKANGGTHVIQTFLSEAISEEVQIKGRTARQGDEGSYGMVLQDKYLEKYGVTISEIECNKGDYYVLLDKKRNEFFKKSYESNKKFIIDAKEKHKISLLFLQAIAKGDGKKIKELLYKWNQGILPPVVKQSRTIVLMDATGSMGASIQAAKNTVGNMFTQAIDVLVGAGLPADCFSLQFACYRAYGQKIDQIIQISPWETKPERLRAFLETIRASGGWREESGELGLQYANQEFEKEEIQQIILIGDAPTTPPSDVATRRQTLGEHYWGATRFKTPTDHLKECAILKSRKVPVHAFYLNSWAQPNFEEISRLTGGESQLLDINSTSGAEMLTRLVTEQILMSAGNQNGGKGEELVKAYRAKYK